MGTLHIVLADLLARTGARAAWIVDAGSAAVVAAAGPPAEADLAALVQVLTCAVAAVGDGPVDVVIASPRALHVLRPVDGLPTVHVQLGLDARRCDVAAARRELADPTLNRAVAAVLGRAAVLGGAAVPGGAAVLDGAAVLSGSLAAGGVPTSPVGLVPPPGHGPRPPADVPALASLPVWPRPVAAASLAIRAMAALPPLPRRSPAQQRTPDVLSRSWADDMATLHRLLAGLHRLP